MTSERNTWAIQPAPAVDPGQMEMKHVRISPTTPRCPVTGRGRLLLVVCLLFLLGALSSRADDVADCSEDSFRDAIASGVATFTEDCEITLTDTVPLSGDVIIDAQGHNVTISGDNFVLLFDVAEANVQIIGVHLVNGLSTNGGAFYIAADSSVTLSNCTLSGNAAVGTNGLDGADGLTSTTGDGGNGHNGTGGVSGYGGAIYSLGFLTLINSTLATNSATGGDGGNGGDGGGGAVDPRNAGNGGNGGGGAAAAGGAIYHVGFDLVVSNCTFSGNTVTGGNGGTGGVQGATGLGGLAGSGAAGGKAYGAAIYSTQAVMVVGCTFSDNLAHGGDSMGGGTQENGNGKDGAKGADSFGAGIYAAGGSITNCTFYNNNVSGGAGGNGGDAPDPIHHNAGHGGNGGTATGGGLYSFDDMAVVSCTFSNCNSFGGTNGLAGTGLAPAAGSKGPSRGGDIANGAGTFILQKTILATNQSGGAAYGPIDDAGYNIGFGSTITFTSGSGSFKTNNAKLGSLADNGGPTKTMALLSGSPALDKIPVSADFPVTDQRGIPRPVNGLADIGAFEFQAAGAPFVIQQPTNTPAQLHSNATFFVTVGGAPPFTYRWFLNGSLTNTLRNAASSMSFLTVTNATPSNAGPYTVTISNIYGVATSAPAFIVFSPMIVTNPQSQTVAPGQNVTFSVVANGDLPLAYQWQHDGIELPGATGSSVTITNAQTPDLGDYLVVVTNAYGSVTSAPATLNLLVAITGQPSSQTAPAGGSATFSVTAVGSPPLSYQWRFNGANRAGATGSSLNINPVRGTDAGTYDVIVTNSFNSVTSSPATLTVTTAASPQLSQPTASGTNFTFNFPTDSNFTYVVEFKTNLSSPTWTPLATNPGTGNPLTITNSMATFPTRFFRVRVQ